MSRRITLTRKLYAMLFAVLFLQISANALTYTAVADGNFSSGSTWSGGVAPSQTILLDQIVIPSGRTVTISQALRINGALAAIDVNGTLTSSNNSALILSAGALTGSGTINVDSIALGLTTGFTFDGSLSAENFSSTVLNSTTSADITINTKLWLNGSLEFLPNSSLLLANNATIVITGGVFTTSGGTLNLNNNYNVIYRGVASNSGLELSGAGLKSVTLDLIDNTDGITLSGNLSLSGTLSLISGRLILNGNDLTVNSAGTISAAGNGSIISTSLSNITINSTALNPGTLNFAGSGSVNDFTLNISAGSQLYIEENFTIHGALSLTSGTLNFSNSALTLSGSLIGSGALSGNMGSDLEVSASTGLVTPIRFSSGSELRDFIISGDSGAIVIMASPATVNGELNISENAQLNITDERLTLNGTVAGLGTLTTSSGTILNIYNSGNTVLQFTGTHGVVGTLNMDGGVTASTSLTGNLQVANMFSLQSGALILAGYDLEIGGQIADGGAGHIQATPGSSVRVITTAALEGGLYFSNNAHTLDSLTVNIGGGNSLAMHTMLDVVNELQLQSGIVDIESNDLTILAGGLVTGGSDSSYVNTSGGGSLHRTIEANASATFDIGTDIDYAPAMVEFNTGADSGSVGISVQSNVMALGTTGTDMSVSQSMVDATWHVTSDITGNLDLDLKVMWNAGMEVNNFARSNAYISHYTNADWDSTTSIAATTEANGMYSIRRDGFTSLSPFAVFDGNTFVTGIKEAVNSVEFRMFPNPSSTYMIVNCPEANNENLMVDIMNIQGGVVKSYNLTSDNYNIPVSELASGSYIARVYNAKVNGVKKFTKM